MIDRQWRLSNSQAITATAGSTDYIDLLVARRSIGDGCPVWLTILCTVAMTDAGSDSTVTPSVETDDNTGFASPTTQQSLAVFPALSPIGTRRQVRLQPWDTLEQYMQIKYTVANGNLSTGSFSAALVTDPDRWYAHPSGFLVS